MDKVREEAIDNIDIYIYTTIYVGFYIDHYIRYYSDICTDFYVHILP